MPMTATTARIRLSAALGRGDRRGAELASDKTELRELPNANKPQRTQYLPPLA